MTKARVCDRCGKVMKHGDKYHTAKFKSYSVNDEDPNHWDSAFSCDLCPECIKKFEGFIKE